jgi:ATP-dependent Clp protease ATP-binding subunit ClpA
MVGIVEIQPKQLQKLLDERKVTLDIDAEGKKWLANAGYDPVYGARPLKRMIQRGCRILLPKSCWPARSARAIRSKLR